MSMANQSPLSHLRLVVGRADVPPPIDLSDTSFVFPYPEIDATLKSPWARAAGAALYGNKRKQTQMLDPKGVRERLECLCRVDAMLIQSKMSPTDLDWARFMSKEKSVRLRDVLTYVEKYIPRLMPSPFAWEESAYLRSLAAALKKIEGSWKEELIKAYAERLDRKQQRYRDRGWHGEHARLLGETKWRQIRSVMKFLDFVEDNEGIANIGQIKRVHVDKFLTNARIPRQGLRDFLNMLKRRGLIAQGIKVDDEELNFDVRHLLMPKEIAEITSQLLSISDQNLDQEVLVALFVIHYAQTAASATKLRIENVGWLPDGTLTVRFGAVDLPIHPVIRARLEEWLEHRTSFLRERGDIDNPYLFVDRRLSLPLSSEHIYKRLGISQGNFKLWRSSAILNAFRNGVRSARVVVDGFGVSMPTALRYQRVFGNSIRTNVSLKA